MLAQSLAVASSAQSQILNHTNKHISYLEQLNKNKKTHTGQKIDKIFTEIGTHYYKPSDQAGTIDIPQQLPAVKCDSLMSVTRVHNLERYRSEVRQIQAVGTVRSASKPNSRSLGKVCVGSGDKMRFVGEVGGVDQKMEKIEDGYRARIIKQQQKKRFMNQPKDQKPSLTDQQKQNLTYDYNFNILKFQKTTKTNILSSLNSLKGHASRDVRVRSVGEKMQKTAPTQLETRPVDHKKKKKNMNATDRISQQSQQSQQSQVEEKQPVCIEFSKIVALDDRFECQPGVSFKFNGIIKSKRSKTLPGQLNNTVNEAKISRIKGMRMKNRLSPVQSNNNSLQILTIRTAKSQMETSLQQSGSVDKNLKSARPSNNTRILVKNEGMMNFLLSTEIPKISNNNNSEGNQSLEKAPKPQNLNQKQQKKQALDANDKFNINYIKGAIKIPHRVNNRNIDRILAVPFASLKSRKGTMIQEIRKKFQQTLRANQFCSVDY